MTRSKKEQDWEAVRHRDRALVAACLKGDEQAWATLWERYGPLVKAVAHRTGCDAEEARDVVQKVALVALQNLATLKEPAKVAGWLAGTARYQALATLRQRRRHDGLDPSSAAPDAPPDERLVRDERLALLRSAFVHIDPRCQRLLRRLELQQPADSYEAVAAAEGLAPTSIGPIRRRCLERLRKQFEKVSRLSPPEHCTSGG